MEVFKAIKSRRAIRQFQDNKDIPFNIFKIIIEAGRLAPSSKNSQPVKLIIIKDKTKMEKISQCTYSGDFLPSAPVAIAFFTKDAKFPEVDAARAIQNVVIQAWAFGVGTCWIANYWGDKVKKILKIPASGNYKLITVMPFGYPHPDVIKPRGKRLRQPSEEVIFLEEFGKPYS